MLNPHPSSERPPLSYTAFLRHRLETAPPRQKGARTRERLKLGAAEVLQENGYHDLKASDVSARAGLSEGLFYVYFDDKDDVTRTVLHELIDDFLMLHLVAAREVGVFAAIRETNRGWLRLARANAGLFRCLLQFGDDDAAFAAHVHQSNRAWYERVARSVARAPSTDVTPQLLLTVYLLGAMMDEMLRKLLVNPDGELRRLLDDMGADDEAIADSASLLWFRTLFPGASLPVTPDLAPDARRLALDWDLTSA